MNRYIISVLVASAITACSPTPCNVSKVGTQPHIFPDYADVCIPVGIAPLNFSVDSADYLYATATGSTNGEINTNGPCTNFDLQQWHTLTQQNKGGKITISVVARIGNQWKQYEPFSINISTDTLPDYGLTYRKIAPGYETFSSIGIFQRCLSSFAEEPIICSSAIESQCMNCHTACHNNPSIFTMHVRGPNGGTLVQRNGQRTWLCTKTDSTIANCMYPYWHPSGNYCAYSVGKVHQIFLVGKESNIEVLDESSDATILDVRTNQLLLAPCLMTPDLETYPTFSADGSQLFYCTAKARKLPAEYDQLRYDICAVSFNDSLGTLGTHIDTLLKVSDKGVSATLPRPSSDGKFLIYCLTSYGYFPIDHPEADLWIMDLRTRQSRPLTEVNSNNSESFHNWSSNSRWIVFSSRRVDGLYSLPYIAHIDTAGIASKPFVLPQLNPKEFYLQSLYSYNVPEFTLTPVEFDIQEAQKEIFSNERIQVTTKNNY